MLPVTHQHLSLPVLHPVLQPFQPALERLAKPAWLLKGNAEVPVSRYHTHITGVEPYVPQSEGWPSCSKCSKPLQFIWQINFGDFSDHLTFEKNGLFQFFYCWECCPDSSEDFGWACRWYPDFDATRAEATLQARCPYKMEDANNWNAIAVDILPFLSVPAKFSQENPIPAETQNEMVSEDEGRLWAVYSFTKGLYFEDEMISRVGGYAPWVQFDDETPNCPVCGNRSEFVAAIGSDDTDLIWGDSGYWYFFACKSTDSCGGLNQPLMAAQCY